MKDKEVESVCLRAIEIDTGIMIIIKVLLKHELLRIWK